MDIGFRGQVQQSRPFGYLSPKRLVTLPLSHVHPVIRIAHRVNQPLTIAERIIFDHELVLILRGEGELFFGQERCQFSSHQLLSIPPFQPHRFVDAEKCPGEHIAIHFDFSPDLSNALGDGEYRTPYEIRLAPGLYLPRSLFVPPGQRLEQTLLDVIRAQVSPTPATGLTAVGSLMTALALILQTGEKVQTRTQDTTAQARVSRVIALMQASLAESLTAEELAEAAGISVSRLNTIFRQVTGRSPFEYLRHARVAEARRLLADPTLSVKEIATRTGFEDSLHFSKVFRRIDGLPPTHYRSALLAYESKQSEQAALP